MRRSGNGGVEVSRFGRNYPDPLGRDRHAGAHRRVGDEDEQPPNDRQHPQRLLRLERLSKNCWYKKVGLWCTVQCDYISLSASKWKALGTLPAGYRPVIKELTDEFKVVSGAAFNRGENNIGLIEINGSGVVSMYATVASDYWSANIVFPCA